jgi:hypothetical protein
VIGLEILDRLLLDHYSHHRVNDAWDLLDGQRRVAAVLCPRGDFVAVSLPPGPERLWPERSGRVPYDEEVAARVTGDGNPTSGTRRARPVRDVLSLEKAAVLLRELVDATAFSREDGYALIRKLAA